MNIPTFILSVVLVVTLMLTVGLAASFAEHIVGTAGTGLRASWKQGK